MNDPLEKFIRQNRGEFDDKQPSDRVWNSVYKKLNGESNPSFNWIWKAAAILFFLTSSFMFYKLRFDGQADAVAISKQQLNEDFKTVESYYVQKISEKKELIYDFEENSVNVNGVFEQDLQKLEAMYEVLKDELRENPSKKVVDALILNLLVRVDILNAQLQELENISRQDKEEPEINV
ncbi:hypothetical protein C900_05059 [Fulvivirga imtechensis AK7]|uniref:Anti-sigma factor n=1 Tax=Fulvivirga imtechensis AK7 TaxID=1237149 RepID=L8JPD2_9BACT|nr:hypothetical protein [Fulvivirga imtechensis]ELR69369.1 hypothetical protein C900_05059 [Fulvivirga imtechensis AK7]